MYIPVSSQPSPKQKERMARENKGSKYAHRVINEVSSYLLQCQCTLQLLPFLEARGVLTNEMCAMIINLPESEAANSVVKDLKETASDSDSHKVIGNLYLALLDCYEELQSIWCRSMARDRLRPAVLSELNQLEVNHYDLRVVLDRLPPVPLEQHTAAQLRLALGLSGSSATELKEIVKQGVDKKISGFRVSDLVLGLLLTPLLGKYVSLLLPYYCCNPPQVCELIYLLQQNWTRLASHLGYSKTEIDDIIRAAGSTIHKQIQLFLKVWWMPYCGEDRTQPILRQVFQERLQITLSPVHVKDDGCALLRACMENEWQKATTLIQSGSHLGARSEDGRTPLMYACLRGQERVVQLLIDKGADPQVMDKRGDSCLHYPETLRNRTILECLLHEYKKLGVSVNLGSLSSECSPLSIACKCGAVNSAELLLQHGADPNGCSNGKHRPLVEASARGHVGLVNLLLKYRADVNATGKDGITPLLQACTSNHWSVSQVLMEKGADVNKCGTDCASPLFAAVSANSFSIASELIKKGAIIDAVQFQPGAVEGKVELTPLAHAAGKGLKSMVKLLIDNGANVNYLCSDTMPPLGFSIIGDHIPTFHQLLDSPNLDKSLTGLSTSIITSVRTEKYYYTEILLDQLGGAQQALMRAQQNQMDLLTENILMYMQAVNHPELSDVAFVSEQLGTPAVSPPRVTLSPEEQHKIEDVLTHFCRICVSAVLESPDISHESLVEIARATSSRAVADFFHRALAYSHSAKEIKHDFLHGTPSPLRFLIENKILTAEMFQVEVLKFHHDDVDQFYEDLMWTFRHMSGGADLPTNIHAMLTQLFSGRFTPRTTSREGSYHGIRESKYGHSLPRLESVPEGKTISSRVSYAVVGKLKPSFKSLQLSQNKKGINSKLCDTGTGIPTLQSEAVQSKVDMNRTPENLNKKSSTPSSSTESGGSEKSNVSLPSEKSKAVQKVVENVENNYPDTTDTDTDNTGSPIPSVTQSVKARSPEAAPSGSTSEPDALSEPMTTPETNTGSTVPPVTHPAMAQSSVPEAASSGGTPAPATEGCSDEELYFRLPNCVVRPTGVELGHGSYGDVVEVEYRGKIYAAKKYRHADVKDLIGVFGREHEILARIRHHNIVPYYGVCKLATDNTTVIVMRRMQMNLSMFLEDKKNVNTTLPRKFQLLFDIARGLNHLHTENPAIIHRDLTATNVLLDSNGVAKIGDFGNSRMVDLRTTPEILTSNPGTIDYMPPEALEGVIQHRPHPILRPTYREHGSLKARSEVERRKLFLDEVKTKLDGGEQHELYSIIITCLQDEPHTRPSCVDILDSSIFTAFVNNS